MNARWLVFATSAYAAGCLYDYEGAFDSAEPEGHGGATTSAAAGGASGGSVVASSATVTTGGGSSVTSTTVASTSMSSGPGCSSCASGTDAQDPLSCHCYRLVANAATWFTADCAGGQLAGISSAAEDSFLASSFGGAIGGGFVWIGLKEKSSFPNGLPPNCTAGCAWCWKNGETCPESPGSYSNWKPGEPSAAANCTVMGSSGNWSTRDCMTSHPFLCEFDAP